MYRLTIQYNFAWEATWEKVLTLDRLQRRGWHLPNRCFLCGCEEENVNHILLHCTVVRALWEIVLALFGAKGVPRESQRDVSQLEGPFVGRKRKRIWTSIPLCIFWTVWKERNRLTFRGGYYVYVLYALWLFASFNIFELTYQKKKTFLQFLID